MLLVAPILGSLILASVLASKRLGRIAVRPGDIATVRWVASGAFYSLLLPFFLPSVALLLLHGWELNAASGLLLPFAAVLGHVAVHRLLPRTDDEPGSSSVTPAARAVFGGLYGVQALCMLWFGLMIAALPVLQWAADVPALRLLLRGLANGAPMMVGLVAIGTVLQSLGLLWFLVPPYRRVAGRIEAVTLRETFERLFRGTPMPEVSGCPGVRGVGAGVSSPPKAHSVPAGTGPRQNLATESKPLVG